MKMLRVSSQYSNCFAKRTNSSPPKSQKTKINADMYIYLQRIFSFCETAESKNKIYVFDTTLMRGCGMYKKLVNLYKMKSRVMLQNFITKEGGNVMIQKPHLTFHKNTEWMKLTAVPHY